MIALKPQYLDLVVAAKDRMVRLGPWKLSYQPLVGGALYKLFHVAEDPGCQRDVLHLYPDVAARLRAILDPWIGVDERARAGQPQPRPEPAAREFAA
jgi:hypothetical protein